MNFIKKKSLALSFSPSNREIFDFKIDNYDSINIKNNKLSYFKSALKLE